ncbi:MAG: hypothetical protein E6H08_07185 [Bacteroidetes bacterium]|nr:MAG: hypothetical protein E6H08_07185 [Bacteroidota bacterium]
MKRSLFVVVLFIVINSFGQETTIIKTPTNPEFINTKVFYAQKVINSKSVEVHPKGIMDFSIDHYFGDIAGDNGGVKHGFFGLDGIKDVRIGFQLGLSDRLNILFARAKGSGFVTNQYEWGLKYQAMRQKDNDPSHPLSLTFFANDVLSAMKATDTALHLENSFEDFGSRHSQIVQVLVARKFGKLSLQLNPLYLHTNYVEPGAQENLFAVGGALRLPLSKKLVLLADYFHTFRSQESIDFFASKGIGFHDPFGIGLEIITEGHVFHLNFTNATDILENRFIRGTTSSWGDGEFRWAFTLTRNFVVFKDKKAKGK